MSKKLKTEAVDHLFDAILCLQNREECYTFFEDVCTVNELLSLSQRFEVAGMLRDQKTYLDIAEKTGAARCPRRRGLVAGTVCVLQPHRHLPRGAAARRAVETAERRHFFQLMAGREPHL